MLAGHRESATAVRDEVERLDLAADDGIIAATEGVTASFVRELVRRSVLRRLALAPSEPVRLDGATLADTLDGLAGERSVLTRAMLGG